MVRCTKPGKYIDHTNAKSFMVTQGDTVTVLACCDDTLTLFHHSSRSVYHHTCDEYKSV